MTLTQKIELIRQELEKNFNGNVTAAPAYDYPKLIIVTLRLNYTSYNFSYPVTEESIEMSDPHDIATELDTIFMSLILNYIRGEQ